MHFVSLFFFVRFDQKTFVDGDMTLSLSKTNPSKPTQRMKVEEKKIQEQKEGEQPTKNKLPILLVKAVSLTP